MNTQLIKQLTASFPTPMYAFDIGVLSRRIAYLQEHLPQNITLCYAIKANTFITKAMDRYMSRFEVCSPGEAYICQNLGISDDKLVISGVYKTPEFIEDLVSNHPYVGCYTIESPEQCRLLKTLSRKYQVKLPVLLRLTSGNQFGLDLPELRDIVEHEQETFDIHGIQFYSGTQKHSLKRLKRELDMLDEVIENLKNDYGFVTRELEFGPGLQVCYFEGDVYNEAEFLDEFSQLLRQMHTDARLVLEMGRAIAASCGTYLTKVVDIKTNKKQNYAIVDGGIHHLVYFGQSMAMKHPVYELYPPRSCSAPMDWNLCGSLCTANDILVKQLPVENLSLGDVFAFQNTGAYCMIEGISLFLSRELPRVVLIDENGNLSLVRNEVATDPINTPKYERNE